MSPNNRERKPGKPAPRKNTKATGERSEAAFLNTEANRGFGVAEPWGDSRRYDFILDNGERIFRIQVKCTESIRARAYETRATSTTGKALRRPEPRQVRAPAMASRRVRPISCHLSGVNAPQSEAFTESKDPVSAGSQQRPDREFSRDRGGNASPGQSSQPAGAGSFDSAPLRMTG